MCTVHLRYYFAFVLLLIGGIHPAFSLPKGKAAKKEVTKWAIQKSSTLRIEGSSNVNTFGCDVQDYYQTDTICVQENVTNKNVSFKGAIEIDIMSFDCHNKMLTSDLRKTLKVNEHPQLIIRFLSLDRLPVISNNKDFLKGLVEIDLGGVCRRFEICYTFTKAGSAQIELKGNRLFSFADFNLKAPRKLAGLVKVKDKFNVDFTLILNPVAS